jgi:hypothetical protein
MYKIKAFVSPAQPRRVGTSPLSQAQREEEPENVYATVAAGGGHTLATTRELPGLADLTRMVGGELLSP